MGDTKIEWADRVWNPITGCTKVSDGCRNCYAERMSKRLAGRAGYPEDGFKVTLHPEKLDEPLRWKKPARIFVCSMGDLFHRDVPDEFLDQVFAVMAIANASTGHSFMVLTKRPERMQKYIKKADWSRAGNTVWDTYIKRLESPLFLDGEIIPANVSGLWLGVSVENQKTADERIPLLLQTPAAKRFVSYEPALGPAIIPMFGKKYCEECKGTGWVSDHGPGRKGSECAPCECKPSRLDWVIMGGESGPGARPMHPDWVRSVRDQCQAAGVPFFFKQWGGFASKCRCYLNARLSKQGAINTGGYECPVHDWGIEQPAGCLLDSKEHKERP